MSSEVAVRIEDLSKTFKVYSDPKDRLMQAFTPWKKRYSEVAALKSISLDIRKGETFGIVGKNGSGKSTLLEIIAGVLSASAGTVVVDGRVSALLQLGAGFNPEYTGRQNVELSAAIHGMSARKISETLQQILDFADIGWFIDQPVKTYSSGMFVRLAFAVAILSDPEILIVDEALAVGDELFQRKCFARIEQIKESGATILFVSHGLGTITEICDRAALIDEGELLMVDVPKKVADQYLKLLYANPEQRSEIRHEILMDEVDHDALPVQDANSVAVNKIHRDEYFDDGLTPESTLEYPRQGARIFDVRVTHRDCDEKINVLIQGRTYKYRYKVEFLSLSRRVHFGMLIRSTSGVDLAGLGSHATGESEPEIETGKIVEVEYEFVNVFTPGVYVVNAGCSGFVGESETFLHRIIDAYAFRVEMMKTKRRWAGHVSIASEPAFKIKFR